MLQTPLDSASRRGHRTVDVYIFRRIVDVSIFARFGSAAGVTCDGRTRILTGYQSVFRALSEEAT